MYVGVIHHGFILFETLWVSWTWVAISFPILWNFQLLSPEVFTHGLSFCLLLLGFLWIKCWGFIIVPEVSKVVLLPFNFFFPLSFIYFHYSIFYLTYPIFCLSYSTVGFLQSAFDLLYCIIHYWLTLFYFFHVLVKHLLHLLNPCL